MTLQNASFNNTTIAGNFGLQLSRKTELRTVFRSEAGRSGNPGPWAFERPDLDAYYRRRDIGFAGFDALSNAHMDSETVVHRE
jgi:hypothetical protein